MCKRLSVLLALALLAVLAIPAAAQIEPQGDAVAARQMGLPELAISGAQQPPSKLPAALAATLTPQLTALGAGLGYYDVRAGRWGTLITARPLIPGKGVGNALTWTALGRTAPANDAELKDAAWQAFKAWLVTNGTLLGVDTAQLGAPTVGSYEGGRLVQISAPRVVDDVPVRGSFVKATLNSGNLVLYGVQRWGAIDVSTDPAISSAQAQAAVAQYLNGFTVTGWRKPELQLVPLASGAGLTYRLAWSVGPRVQGSLGGWEALVDAHNGQLISFADTNQYLDKKKVVGGTFPVSNDGLGIDGSELPGSPMSRAYVFKADGTQLTANSEGLVDVDGEYGTRLTGPFLRILDGCGQADDKTKCPFLDLKTSSGTDCAAPSGSSAGNTHSGRTGFYEVNRLIDQAKSWLGPAANSSTPAGWLNRQMTANMNINNACNAFFSFADTNNPTTGSINFYKKGVLGTNDCRNTGEIAAVFDHEWGHGLDMYDDHPGVSNPGEAYADMVSVMRLNQSCVARGFFLNNSFGGVCTGNGDPCTECSGVREIDWKKRQSGRPHDLLWVQGKNPTVPGTCGGSGVTGAPINAGPCGGSTHCEGTIISESVWDLLKRDLPCHGTRWESFAGGAVAGGRCSGGAATSLDENSALVLTTRVFYLAAGGVTYGFQCDPTVGGCNADSWYLNFLAADDDDGSILDGTPHFVAINDAFGRHGISCPIQTQGVPGNFGCTATPPPGKTTVSATAGVRSATISWTPVAGAGEYWVLRTDGVHGCDFGKTRVATVSASSPLTLTQTDLLDGRTYYYSVVAVAGAGGVGLGSCAGGTSPCASVTPLAPGTSTSAASAIVEEHAETLAVEGGDGDEFLDNCEKGTLTFKVVSTGGQRLTNVRVTAIQPSASQTQLLTALPIAVGDLEAGCGSPSTAVTTLPASFRFKAGGLTARGSLTFQVTVAANELAQPVTATLTVNDTETDLQLGDVSYGFETDNQGWTATSGTFERTNLPPPAPEGSYYMKSSSLTNDACDRVRSPLLRFTKDTTLSLQNQFQTEPEVDPANGLPFYDRANVGIVDTAGVRAIVSPSGGRAYNALNTYTGCNAGPGWASSVNQPVNTFAESSFSAGALGFASLTGYKKGFVEVSNGTDALNSHYGFQFDQVRITSVLLPVADAQTDTCPVACASSNVDDNDPAVEYTGGWHLREDSRASSGVYHRRMGSGNGNASPVARVVFAGDTITYKYVMSAIGGSADILIDGVKKETLSFAASGPGGTGSENPTFGHSKTYSGLGSGSHELRIVHKTGAAYVDGFDIPCTEGGADASAAQYHSETTVSSAKSSDGAVIERSVTVGSKDVALSVVTEGSLVPLTVKLIDPLGNLVASGQALVSGLSISGLDAAVAKAGTYKVQVLNTAGAFKTLQISTARTVRN